MIEVLSDLPGHVVGVQASGQVTAEDYRKVLVPAIEQKLAQHERVRLLYVLSDQFDGYTGGAAWEDAKVGMRHLTAFQRIAVVTDVESVGTMVRAFGFALPGEVRVYPGSKLAEAREWISEPPSPGRLSFELDRERGVLLVQPRGSLEAADFDRLGAEVDPYLAEKGTLRGLAVVSEHFPGWEDLFAVMSHLRFVRDHHRKVRRLALITESRFASAVPRIARVFVEAEIRAFSMSERDAALAWVGDD